MIRSPYTRRRRTASPANQGTAAGAAAAIAIMIVLFPPITAADLYLSADRSGILPVNATIISFLSLSAGFGAILAFGLARDRGSGLCRTYLATAPVVLAFVLLTIVQLAGGFLPAAYWYEGGKFVYLPLYSLVVLIFSIGIASAPAFRKYHRVIICVCLLAAAGSIFVDVFFPQTFSKLYTRPAGFMKNPNAGAATVTILAIATVDWTRNRASDMLLWLIAGTAVLATLSRGGMLLFAVAFAFYTVVMARSALQLYARRLSIVLVAVVFFAPLYSIANLGDTVYSAENRRIQLLAALLSGESTTLTADSRVTLLFNYLDLVSERPVLGHGTGFIKSQVQGPHNTFLSLWVENGLLGLAGHLTLLIVAFWYFRRRGDARGQALCIAVFALSGVANDVVDMRPFIVSLGLSSVLAVPESFARTEQARPTATRRLAGSLGRRRTGPDLRGVAVQ